jgi:hypothetical protein
VHPIHSLSEHINIDIIVPWWLKYLLKQEAWDVLAEYEALFRERMHNDIQVVLQVLNFFLASSPGYRMQSVRIDDGNYGGGIVEVRQCPDELLRRFASISQVNAPPAPE